jgi:hypothetical protein
MTFTELLQIAPLKFKLRDTAGLGRTCVMLSEIEAVIEVCDTNEFNAWDGRFHTVSNGCLIRTKSGQEYRTVESFDEIRRQHIEKVTKIHDRVKNEQS